MFFGSAEVGTNNALLYMLIGNCRRQGLDPESYLAEAIRRLPAGATPEQAAARSKTVEADESAAALTA